VRSGSAAARQRGRGAGLPRCLAATLLLGACQLTEVTVPVGEERIIVQSVLSRTAGRQFVVVERSVTGAGAVGGVFSSDEIPPDGPGRPIEGALVVIGYDPGTGCVRAADTLPPVGGARGLYQAEGLCVPAPGSVVRLRVETPMGDVVTGRTVIPGARVVAVTVAGDTVAPVPGSFVVNRDHDTLNLGADAILARALQVEIHETPVAPGIGGDDAVFFAVTDSLGFRLPGDLINPFEEEDVGEAFFRGGESYDITIVLADTNYYDFVRSRSDPLTGRGFINRLEGGIGVFGSVETHTYRMRVVADADLPEEGTYRVRGTVGGRAVDVTWELYFDPVSEQRFAAFIRGSWYDGPVDGGMSGNFGFGEQPPDVLDAFFETADPSGGVTFWGVRGTRAPLGTAFQVTVEGFGDAGPTIRGTLSAVQVTGPGARGAPSGGPDGRQRRP